MEINGKFACPAVLSGLPVARRWLRAAALSLIGIMCAWSVQAQSACAGLGGCWEAPEMAAIAKSVRTSAQGGYQFVTVTLQFFNRTATPFSLAYTHAGSVLTDNRGNRLVPQGKVAGLPPFNNTLTPSDFSLAPGGSREATVEFSVYAPQAILGDQFDLTFATRELRPVGGNRVDPGVEHAVSIRGLTTGAVPAVVIGAPIVGSPAVVARAPSGCVGLNNCFSDGALQMQVIKISTQRSDDIDDEQHAAIFLRITNRGDKPLKLAHKLGTAQLNDANGNVYKRHTGKDASMVSVLAVLGAQGPNNGLVVEPGASRSVVVRHLIEHASKLKLSGRFDYEIQLVELDESANTIRHDYVATFKSLSSQALVAQQRPKSEFEQYQEQENKEFQRSRPSSGN
jgi:hypothetical protein